jgi:hypothetical protein
MLDHGLFALNQFLNGSSLNFRSPSLTKRGASSSSLLSVDNNDSENELIKREQVRAVCQILTLPNQI